MARKNKRKIAVLDFETDPFKHGRMPQAFAAGYYDGADYIEFWGADCWKRLGVFLQDQDAVVYAHHGGRFDFFYLWPFIEESYTLNVDKKLVATGSRFMMIGSRIAIATVGQCELRDSWLILPMPLSAYQKDEINYDIFEADEREKPENKTAISNYLKGDCVYLWNWVNGFVERFGRRLTVASAAFNELGKTGYLVNRKTSKNYDDDFRPFYFGGRTQAIKPGVHKGHFKYYDINSAYPFAMLHQHPYGPKYDAWHGDDLNGELPDNEVYFARVIAKSRGALPLRVMEGKDKGAVYFPEDWQPREFLATSWEIRAGIDTGTLEIVKILEVFIHEETNDFSDYVLKHYEEKKQAKAAGDTANEIHAKLMLNSAYGKFGQNGEQFREHFILPAGYNPLTDEDREMAETMGIEPGEYLTEWLGWELEGETPNGLEIWSRPDPQDYFYNVATAASITGFVRAYLWRAICAAKNPLYCDTDSMICENADIKLSAELGDWKLEAETKKRGVVYIGGKKLYTFIDKDGEEHKAHKGARLTHEQIKECVETGNEILWFNEAPSFSVKYGVNPTAKITDDNPHAFIKRKIKPTARASV